ncbi:SusD family protein [compost metagenome]
MDERCLELAWEGHASYDYYRNGLPMIRNYADYSAPNRTVQADDKKVISPLPESELLLNPNLVQNPL